MLPVEFRDVSYEIGGVSVLSNFSLAVQSGETVALLGRSGAGKTTVLKLINGLLAPSNGEVLVEGRSTAAWNPAELKRRTGYVIQDIGLFPHYTVAQNVALVPRLEGWSASDIERRTVELLNLVGLPPAEFRSRYPRQLSGGQRQRVGVARALAADPPILLFDEPFAAADPILRVELQNEFQRLKREIGKTTVFVTHDLREALRLGDRIALLCQGRLCVVASPQKFCESKIGEAQAFLRSLEG